MTFECTLDSETKPEDCSTRTITYGDPAAIPPQAPLSEGSHTFSVVAKQVKDTSTPTVYTWTVDLTPPAAPTMTKRPPSTSGSSVSFEFAASDASDPVTFVCSLDGAPAATCASPASYTGLRDGAHAFSVNAVDAATNESTATVYNWTVDTTAPVISMSSAPSLRTSDTQATFAFTSNDAGASFACSLDGAAFTACTAPATYADLADGAHTFMLEAVDGTGNGSSPVAYTWVVDTTSPAPVAGLRALVAYRRVTLSWRLPIDDDLDHLTLFERRPRSLESTAAYTGLGTRFTEVKIDNSRTYRFSIVTFDSVGNASGTATVAIPPAALLLSPRPGAKIRRSPSLSWAPAPRAKFYNVQIFHNGKKVLSTWPRSPHLRMAAQWTYARHRRSLSRGWYDWYVWPAFGSDRSLHYGQELGHSSFRR